MTSELDMFQTDQEEKVPAVSPEQLLELMTTLYQQYSIPAHICTESASLAFSMIVRSSLGLSASEASICALISDNLAGQVALGTLRMLCNAGAQGVVLLLDDPERLSQETELQLKILDKLEVPLVSQFSDRNQKELEELFSQSHTLLCGVTSIATEQTTAKSDNSDIYQLLNELHTPIHSVLTPPGIDQFSGAADSDALVSSSTMSLGVPLIGLGNAKDHVGRHYLCDIQIPRKIYHHYFGTEPGWFARQPVIQIFPSKSDTQNS